MIGHNKWAPLIQGAMSEAELVRVMRDYLSTLLPSDIEQIPKDCRLESIASADQVSEAALMLTQAELGGTSGSPGHDVLHEMALTFAAAQARLRHLRSPFPLPKS